MLFDVSTTFLARVVDENTPSVLLTCSIYWETIQFLWTRNDSYLTSGGCWPAAKTIPRLRAELAAYNENTVSCLSVRHAVNGKDDKE